MTIKEEICEAIHKKFGCKCNKSKIPYCELVEKLYLIVCRLE